MICSTVPLFLGICSVVFCRQHTPVPPKGQRNGGGNNERFFQGPQLFRRFLRLNLTYNIETTEITAGRANTVPVSQVSPREIKTAREAAGARAEDRRISHYVTAYAGIRATRCSRGSALRAKSPFRIRLLRRICEIQAFAMRSGRSSQDVSMCCCI